MSDVLWWRISGLVSAALIGVVFPVLLLEPWTDMVAFSMLPVGTQIAVFILPLVAVWMAVVIVFVDASILREVDQINLGPAPEAGLGAFLVIMWRGTRALCRRLRNPDDT